MKCDKSMFEIVAKMYPEQCFRNAQITLAQEKDLLKAALNAGEKSFPLELDLKDIGHTLGESSEENLQKLIGDPLDVIVYPFDTSNQNAKLELGALHHPKKGGYISDRFYMDYIMRTD